MNLFDPIDKCKIFTTLQKSKILSIIKKNRIIDLLTFLPKKSTEIILVNNYLEILNQHNKPNTTLILMIEIEKISNIGGRQLVIEGRCYNAQCKILFFKVDRLLYSIYKPQTKVIVCGKVEIQNNIITLIHPVHKGFDIETIPYYQIEINYCGNRAKNLFLKKRIHQLLDHIHQFQLPIDWIPLHYRQQYNLPTFVEALKGIHGYGSLDLSIIGNSSKRIILDEIIFYNRLIRNYQNYHHDNRTNKKLRQDINEIINQLVQQLQLPFTLTHQQILALNTIFYDIKYKPPLFRLLQGDVGCGKTIVAVIISYWMILQKFQVIILSPSLTLAQQHYDYFKKFLPDYNIVLFTSQTTKSLEKKKQLLQNIKNGDCSIIIGTHSLLSDSIEPKNLGLIIFDEHHKFGVIQRTQLTEKGSCHILSMTATPSPRTMMLANYGFLDITTISNENNKNRTTFSIENEKINKVLEKISFWLDSGEKIYWVCPKVNSSLSGGISCIERYESIKNLSINCGIIHGQLDPDVINETLENFKNNNIRLLICTTVIEVGIDIKDATIIIIENAEMFGISQLHQLRGRVGRGLLPGKCLLIYNAEKPENIEKIEKFITMETGFQVSNLDLDLRGPGDLIGTHQKGKKSFQFIDKYSDKLLFSIANDIAPYVDDMEFIRLLLCINQEEIYLKKN
jgi:ATP-dependent DNA helicase RecG